MVTVRTNNLVNGALVLPGIATEAGAFPMTDTLRTNATRLTGFVHRIRPNGSEFEFVSPQRPVPHKLRTAEYELVILLVRIDARISAQYDACLQAMAGQTAHQAMGVFSIKNLIPNGRSASSPQPCSLFSKWRSTTQTADQPTGLRIQKKLLTAGSTLSKMQREVYDTIIFGKPINSTTLVQGRGGTGKTHVLLASLVGLLATGFKALLVCKEENTADCLASRALKEVSHDQICRFYPQGIVNAYKNRASVLGYEEGKSDFQGEKISAWSLRQRSTHEIKKAKVVVASVNGCEAVVDAGFNPDIEEASLITDAELCLPLVAAHQSVLAVVIAGDPNQCRPHFISEAVNTHFPALSFCPLERLNTDNAERSTFSLKENFRQVPELGELYNKLAHAKDRMVFVPRPSPVLVNNVNQAISQRALPLDSNYDGQREFFLDVACISHRQDNTHSISNTGGVDAIAEVIKHLVERAGVARAQISVIKPLLIYQSIFISKYFPEL